MRRHSSSPDGHSSLTPAKMPAKADERYRGKSNVWFLLLPIFGILSACDAPPKAPKKNKTFAQSGCQIDRVIDGDTVHVSCSNGANGNLRLMGFDTPETFQPGCPDERALGTKAKIRLQQEIAKANLIEPKTHGPDKYKRLLARLYLDNRDVAEIMIAAGLAVRYSGGKRINWCAKIAGQI